MREVADVGPLYEKALLRSTGASGKITPPTWPRSTPASGTEVFLSMTLIGTQFGIPRAPGEWLDRFNGIVLLAIALGAFGLAFGSHLRDGDPRLIVLPLVSIYYSSLLSFVIFVFLTLVQPVLDRAGRWMPPIPTQT